MQGTLGRQFSYTAYLSHPQVRTLRDAIDMAIKREELCREHTRRQAQHPLLSRGFSREFVYGERHRYRMSRRLYPEAQRFMHHIGATLSGIKETP